MKQCIHRAGHPVQQNFERCRGGHGGYIASRSGKYSTVIERRYKRSAFHGLLGFFKAETLSRELQELLQRRLQTASDTIRESRQILDDLQGQGHRLKLSEPDSDTNLQVWVDGDFAVWFWADDPPKDVLKRIDRIEVLWQKM